MNMEPVRFGVIGCGLMGREFASVSMRWLHLACEPPRPVIVAACDLSPKKSRLVPPGAGHKVLLQRLPRAAGQSRGGGRILRGAPPPARTGVRRRHPRGKTPHRGKTFRHGPCGLRGGGGRHGRSPRGICAVRQRISILSRRTADGKMVPRGRIRADHRGTLRHQAFLRHGSGKTHQLEAHACSQRRIRLYGRPGHPHAAPALPAWFFAPHRQRAACQYRQNTAGRKRRARSL